MIGALIPPEAIGVTASGDGATSPLPAGESRLVAHATKQRQHEFAAGRACARRALAELGWPGFTIFAGPRREPIWPPGIVGSITHCPGYCAAAVAPTGRLLGLGIDAEPDVPLDPALRRRVASPGELAAVGRGAGVDPALLLFSAKEAAFKAWYPLTRQWLDLLDVMVRVDVERRRFLVVALDPAVTSTDLVVRGRWAAAGGHLATVATVVSRC